MKDTAVLVVSCDRYQDLWRPFFTLFFRYWANCPYRVYLLANHQTYPDSRVSTIPVGDDKDWSSNLMRALEQIPQSRILFLLEDYLFTEPVNTSRIQTLAVYMEQKQAGYMRLFPCPGPDVPCVDNPEIGEILKGAKYRLSTQAAIWDKKVLLGLLREGETAWEFEVRGSRRTDALDKPFYSVIRDIAPPIKYFCTAVVRGRWIRDAVDLCRREGVDIDLNVRKYETRYYYWSRIIMPKIMEKVSCLFSKS